MPEEPLIMVCVGDISGNVRGKSIPVSDFNADMTRGLGWTPTNVQITSFGPIAETPYGPFGDLVMTPDPASEVRVSFDDHQPAEHLVLADLTWPDGSMWECCTRSILRDALNKLRTETGLSVRAAFEHEFMFKPAPATPGNRAENLKSGAAYSIGGVRRQRVFGETLLGALREAGITPESFLREYGPDQYEVSIAPTKGHLAADQALVLRELARATALYLGEEITFTPLIVPDEVGNGVHLHFGLLDGNGKAHNSDPDAPDQIGRVAGAFVAGILKYLNSTVALTAPSIPSYLRLTPHSWSASFNNLGYRDREAAIRICPTPGDSADIDPGDLLHFEFRVGDGAANPHLMLATLVLAGLHGIRDKLPTPAVTREDLTQLGIHDLAAKYISSLPSSLNDALGRLEADKTVRSWFPEKFVDVYVAHKRGEIAVLEGKTDAEICAAYADVY